MYENIELRIKRKVAHTTFTQQLQSLDLAQDVILTINDEEIPCYKVHLAFIDNKTDPHHYHVAITPMFDITQNEDTSILVPKVLLFTATNPTFDNNTLRMKSVEPGISVEFVISKKESIQYMTWTEAYSSNPQKFMYEMGIQDGNGYWYTTKFWEFLKKCKSRLN
jgi:hypothetical protein